MAEELTITVSGEGFVEKNPELGCATVSVTAFSEDRDEALSQATLAHAAIMDDMRGFKKSGAVSEYDSGNFGVSFSRHAANDDNPERVTYHVTTSVTASFIDFIQMANWLIEVAAREYIVVSSISWLLTKVSQQQAVAQARMAAVEDARLRAEAYGIAAKLEKVNFVSISEPTAERGGFARAAMVGAASPTGGDSSFGFEPKKIRVPISIAAVFKATKKD